MLHANMVSVLLQMQNTASQEARASTPQASQAFPQLAVGQALTAAIVSRISDGLYLADVGGRPIQLALPATVVTGETLSLRVIRAQPDYVFELLSRSAPAPAPGLASSPASGMSAALSQGAQIIQLALGATAGTGPPTAMTANMATGPAATLTAAQLMLPSAPPALQAPGSALHAFTQQLAAALQTSVAQSGLFYESHLAAWTQGQRTLADIQREPQAQWRAPADGLAAEAPPMLRLQLETLEARQFAWQGPAWPGQPVSITIAEQSAEERARQSAQDDPADQPTWRTTLKLALPQLGGLQAELVACGDTISLSIAAPTAESAARLKSGLPALEERLRTAGLRPLLLRVDNTGAASEPGAAATGHG